MRGGGLSEGSGEMWVKGAEQGEEIWSKLSGCKGLPAGVWPRIIGLFHHRAAPFRVCLCAALLWCSPHLRWPLEDREGEQPRAEPGVEHVFVLGETDGPPGEALVGGGQRIGLGAADLGMWRRRGRWEGEEAGGWGGRGSGGRKKRWRGRREWQE